MYDAAIVTKFVAPLLFFALVCAHPRSALAQGDLDFDLMGDAAQANAQKSPEELKKQAEIDRKVKLRRSLLKAHQGMGFATWALLAATLVIGQLNYLDKFGGGDHSEVYQVPHLTLGIGTTAAFATTGILALAAPNPYPKPIKADAALLHKVSMALATAGMVAQMILGPISASQGGKLLQRDLALGHLITGYATFAFMTVGVFSYVF